MLAFSLLHEKNEARGNADAAGKPTDNVKPAQQPVFEMLQMQACEPVVDAAHGSRWRILANHFARARAKVDSLSSQRHAVGPRAEDADVSIGIAVMRHVQFADLASHAARGPSAPRFLDHG